MWAMKWSEIEKPQLKFGFNFGPELELGFLKHHQATRNAMYISEASGRTTKKTCESSLGLSCVVELHLALSVTRVRLQEQKKQKRLKLKFSSNFEHELELRSFICWQITLGTECSSAKLKAVEKIEEYLDLILDPSLSLDLSCTFKLHLTLNVAWMDL